MYSQVTSTTMDRPLFAVRPSDRETHEKQYMPMDAFQRVSRSLVDTILVVEDTNGNPAEYREWLLHWAGRLRDGRNHVFHEVQVNGSAVLSQRFLIHS